MSRNLALAAVAGGLISLALTSHAQDTSVLDDLYGRGVHAYFSGDSAKSHDLITEAIDNGSQDPRAFYFRGLALRNLGRDDDAKLDFVTGAKLEATGDRVGTRIGTALQRVQGSVRLELESVRKTAKLKATTAARDRNVRRYGDLERDDREMLRQPPAAAGTAPRRPPVTLPEAGRTDTTDPFAEERPAPVPGTTEPPPGEEPPSPATIPAEEPPSVTPPASDDPFAEDPATPPAPRPATPPPEPAEPPAEPAPTSDDPFAEDPAAPPPDPAEPPADPTPPPAVPPPATEPTSDDPFADEAAAPAAAPPTVVQRPAAAPAARSRSIFRALTTAIFSGEDAAAKPADKVPELNVENAADPFADDAEPVPAPAARVTPAAPVEDPFADDVDADK